VKEPFDGTSGPEHGRALDGDDAPAVGVEAAGGVPNGLSMPTLVARERRQPELVHRLDERDQIGRRIDPDRHELKNRRGDGEVRQIHGDDLDRLRDVRGRQLSEVGPLEADDPAVLSQRAAQLTVSGVDRVDAARSSVEERLREPTGCRAEIDDDAAGRVDIEHAQRVGELRGAAKLPAPPQRKRRAHRDEGLRIGARKAVDKHLAVGDRGIWIVQTREAARQLVRERAQPRARSAHEEPPLV
jgi:hypothetical protein